MDANYFGLTDMPFRLTPDDHYFYPSREHRRALSHLLFGLSQGEGIIVVTGEVGAGKTTLVEHLSVRLVSANYSIAKIPAPQGRPGDLLKLVASGFRSDYQDTPGAILLKLVDTLRRQREVGRRSLLIVDEAQSIPFSGLEELRLLSNLSEGGRALLQVILLGQPQFRTAIDGGDLDQLRQRILASYHINALTRDDVQPYIEHRLRTAGWTSRPRFTAESFMTIYEFTEGLPRRLNRLCARLLLHAALEEAEDITPSMVELVAQELDDDLSVRLLKSQPPNVPLTNRIGLSSPRGYADFAEPSSS
ncbi:MAG TPA: AAA family ATPase [Acidocella sp.]|jgi:type II secretory pathway predicted ATPase ExeA|nr:AAA family ATPase [Acidocella sp.]